MSVVSPPRFDVEALRALLRERLAALRPLIVMDVLTAFLEVSSLPCERRLWSFQFAFDEDDGRVARLEARFADRGTTNPSDDDLGGYDVHVLLPHVIPPRTDDDGIRSAKYWLETAPAPGSLVERFVNAFSELGAYRTIERLEARSVEVYAF